MKIKFLTTTALVVFSFYVCHAQDPAMPQPGNPASAQQTQPGTTTAAPDPAAMDRMFIRTASEGGLAEVQFGQLAAQKGNTDAVKKFGQRMVDDHTKLNNDMDAIAENMGARTAKKLGRKEQAEYDKLNGLSGAAFDNEYITMMVMDHRQDLQAFQHEFEVVSDPALKTAIEHTVRVIYRHLQMIEQIAKDQNVSVPAPPSAK